MSALLLVGTSYLCECLERSSLLQDSLREGRTSLSSWKGTGSLCNCSTTQRLTLSHLQDFSPMKLGCGWWMEMGGRMDSRITSLNKPMSWCLGQPSRPPWRERSGLLKWDTKCPLLSSQNLSCNSGATGRLPLTNPVSVTSEDPPGDSCGRPCFNSQVSIPLSQSSSSSSIKLPKRFKSFSIFLVENHSQVSVYHTCINYWVKQSYWEIGPEPGL